MHSAAHLHSPGDRSGTCKQYETRTPSHRDIPKFVAATGVSYEWLLTGEGKEAHKICAAIGGLSQVRSSIRILDRPQRRQSDPVQLNVHCPRLPRPESAGCSALGQCREREQGLPRVTSGPLQETDFQSRPLAHQLTLYIAYYLPPKFCPSLHSWHSSQSGSIRPCPSQCGIVVRAPASRLQLLSFWLSVHLGCNCQIHP